MWRNAWRSADFLRVQNVLRVIDQVCNYFLNSVASLPTTYVLQDLYTSLRPYSVRAYVVKNPTIMLKNSILYIFSLLCNICKNNQKTFFSQTYVLSFYSVGLYQQIWTHSARTMKVNTGGA